MSRTRITNFDSVHALIVEALDEIDAQLPRQEPGLEAGFSIGCLISEVTKESGRLAILCAKASDSGDRHAARQYAAAFRESQATVAAAAIRFLEDCAAAEQ